MRILTVLTLVFMASPAWAGTEVYQCHDESSAEQLFYLQQTLSNHNTRDAHLLSLERSDLGVLNPEDYTLNELSGVAYRLEIRPATAAWQGTFLCYLIEN